MDDLVAQGAKVATTAGEAVRGSRLAIECLLDHVSVREVLDPLADNLAGRTLINVTTTTPAQSRELAAWATQPGVAYLDGGIMAVPEMIGRPGSSILYSGSAEMFNQYKSLLACLDMKDQHAPQQSRDVLVEVLCTARDLNAGSADQESTPHMARPTCADCPMPSRAASCAVHLVLVSACDPGAQFMLTRRWRVPVVTDGCSGFGPGDGHSTRRPDGSGSARRRRRCGRGGPWGFRESAFGGFR